MERSISRLAEAISADLHGKLYGMWLYGSVVLDDFRLGWSDIDILVLTENPISEEQARALLTLRQELSEKEPGNPYYRAMEGVIAFADEYRAQSFTRLVTWGTSGQRVTDRVAKDVFAMAELSKYGRCVAGRDDRSLFPMPKREEIVSAVRAHYDCVRKYARQTDESLYSCGWLLDMARCVYTLRTCDVIAKTQAGIWALDAHLFPEEDALRKTLEIRQNPLQYRGREDVRQWLRELGPTVQRYADVLERTLDRMDRC